MQTLENLKSELEENSLRKLRSRKTPRDLKIVAEGDSWFDYPLVKDVIDHLRQMDFCIYKHSEAGDTLENMVYGSEYKMIRRLNNALHLGPIDLQETLNSIRRYKPRFVLFSAGGNDIVGQEMGFYLNHKNSGQELIRKKVFKEILAQVIRPTIEYFCKVVWKTQKDTDILMDGYDYARPNGKKYLGIVGPWILPNFGKKAITNKNQQKAIIRYLVDEYNKMLADIDKKNPRFHHIDLREKFPRDDQWHNEIHLKGKGYKVVAEMYRERMREVLGQGPV